MEDHLKNKDRLDREWEGLCTYEADPSNTDIANDAANIRKNRYSDTVPCKYLAFKIYDVFLRYSRSLDIDMSRSHYVL